DGGAAVLGEVERIGGVGERVHRERPAPVDAHRRGAARDGGGGCDRKVEDEDRALAFAERGHGSRQRDRRGPDRQRGRRGRGGGRKAIRDHAVEGGAAV